MNEVAAESARAPVADERPVPQPLMTPGEPLVVVRELHKSFMHMGRRLEVLRGIDLTINEGEFLAIVGPSGAGKSTLMHCIGTLDLPTLGSIQFAGRELVGLDGTTLAQLRNARIGFVFQFHHLLPEFNAVENVMMPGLIMGMPKREIDKRARDLLEEVGLGHRLNHRPGELSGGEQQRVALARALVLEPKLLLADEPTGNLDSATSNAIHELFFEINRKHGTTILVVTHNLALADQIPRVVRMVDGKIDTDTSGPASLRELDTSLLERQRALQKAQPAGFGRRTAAKLIDLAFHTLVGFVAAVPAVFALIALGVFGAKIKMPEVSGLALGAIGGNVAFLLASATSERIAGVTLGKLILGVRVRTEKLEPIALPAALARNLAFSVDGMFFGLIAYIAMTGSLMQQRLGDMWGRTVVVHTAELKPQGGVFMAILMAILVNVTVQAATIVGMWLV